MKYFSTLVSGIAIVSALLAQTQAQASFATVATYDNTYDNRSGSLATVACSNGVNGLLTKGFTTFGSLPSFPFIGGKQGVQFNSTNCGTCWELQFEGNTINVLAIDFAANGFNIAQEALDALTNNQAVAVGHFDITAKQVAASVCGLK